jgi:hypothetical protein
MAILWGHQQVVYQLATISSNFGSSNNNQNKHIKLVIPYVLQL